MEGRMEDEEKEVLIEKREAKIKEENNEKVWIEKKENTEKKQIQWRNEPRRKNVVTIKEQIALMATLTPVFVCLFVLVFVDLFLYCSHFQGSLNWPLKTLLSVCGFYCQMKQTNEKRFTIYIFHGHLWTLITIFTFVSFCHIPFSSFI